MDIVERTRANRIFLSLVGVLILVLVVPLLFLNLFANEERDYKLFDELHGLAQEIKAYKKEHGIYPGALTEVVETDELCVKHFGTHCKVVRYKPNKDQSDFRMAVPAFSGNILYYHPQMSMTTEEFGAFSEAERQEIIREFGLICFFCMAYAPENAEKRRSDAEPPIYRQTPPIFAVPQEWPEIK